MDWDMLYETVLDRLDVSKEVSDQEILEVTDEVLADMCRTTYIPWKERKEAAKAVFHSLRKLDILQELIEDPEITEIMINGTDHIFIERGGRMLPVHRHFLKKEKLEDVIQQMVAGSNRVVNELTPIADARLPDGSRVNVVLHPVALNGPAVTIRKFPDKPFTMNDLIRFGALDKAAAVFLQKLVKAKYNLFISGGTGSGKTTFLNALSAYIPADERVITIEDNAELQIAGINNLVSLEARNANMEGCREITIRDLIKASLRMRPNRIIVGEVRGEEAIDLLQAYNTGHDGSISTGHGNSPADMLNRLETMVLMGIDLPLAAIQRQIASGIDILIHLGRMRDKSRKVLEITEIIGMGKDSIVLNPLYEFIETGEDANGKVEGKLQKKGELEHRGKLEREGVML